VILVPKEKEHYRENLRLISEHFGGVQLIPLKQVAEYCGTDVRSLQKDKAFPVKKLAGRYYVAAVSLASWLS
jgi:hypothetical protein